MIKKRTHNPEETSELGREAAHGHLGNLLCLYGDLGAGKTTFVRGLAQGLDIQGRISSPTFTVQRIYYGPKRKLYHFDCYRLETADQLLIQEVQEALERKDGIVAIEWAEKIELHLPEERTEIHFEHADEGMREITIHTQP